MTIEIPVVNPKIHDDELERLGHNISLKLWTKPHMSHINAYRSNSLGGQGLVLAIPKIENQALVSALDSGRETWIEVETTEDKVRFRGIHLTQEFIDSKSNEKKAEFLEVISKPYHPRKTTKAWLRTIGDTPFEEGMILILVPESKEYYIQNLGYPVSFISDKLSRPAHVTSATPSKKIIRAALSGYAACATVVLTHTGALIRLNGISGRNQTAEAVISFIMHVDGQPTPWPPRDGDA